MALEHQQAISTIGIMSAGSSSALSIGSLEMEKSEEEENKSKNMMDDEDEETKLDNTQRPTTATSTARELLDANSPIIYKYLTFDTPLPHPSPPPLNASSAIDKKLLSRPDLSKFQDPFTWSPWRKRFTVYISCIATLFTAYNAGSYAPPLPSFASEYGVSELAALTGITTFCLGFAITPMVLAPFSEIMGRYPVFVVAGIVFEAFQIACAFSPNLACMLISRFLVGGGSSVFSSMVGGVITDIYHQKDRNTAMALFSGGALFGTGLGPLIAGSVAQHMPWRWVFYSQSITCGVLVLVIIVFFKESRGSVLLSKKAKTLNAWYEQKEEKGIYGVDMPHPDGERCGIVSQRIRWKVKSDEARESLPKMMKFSVSFPLKLLFTEPVVFFFSLWVSFAWAVLYMTFASVPLIFSTSHNFNTQQNGFVFIAMMIGAALATTLAIVQDKHSPRLGHFLGRWTGRHKRHVREHGHPPPKPPPASKAVDMEKNLEDGAQAPALSAHQDPELRLYFSCIHSLFLPLGLFLLGFTHQYHPIIPCLGILFSTMGIYSVYLATFNYLADVYHRYSSSALAAQSFCRNVMGAIFPLISNPMFRNLGFAQAASVLGAIGVALTLVPWVLVAWGPDVRKRSRFASTLS